LRSKIVLACAEGPTNREVAARLGLAEASVGKWRSRFVAKRLDGLVGEPRPGSRRTVTDEDVEAVVVRTLQENPDDATHWSTRSMTKTTGMSQSAISRFWRAFGLKPHPVDTFKLSSDPLFNDKVRDIVGLYMCPPDHAVVLCVDEKTQVQALDRTQPIFPLLPGAPERRSLDYKRNGTIDLYAALNLAIGEFTHQLTAQHRAIEFKKFLSLIDKSVPKELVVHIVIDNHSTHKTPAIKKWLLAHPRFHIHFTRNHSRA
jgi:transposase